MDEGNSKEITINNIELNEAKEYWKKTKKSFKNVSTAEILDHYKKRSKSIDPNTGKFKKI